MKGPNSFSAAGDVLSVSRFATTASFQAQVPGGRTNFVGIRVRETAGSTAQVRAWRGIAADLVDDTGKLLANLRLAANVTDTQEGIPGGGALEADQGVFVQILSGTVDVTVFYTRG